jgi:hypothetical protein
MLPDPKRLTATTIRTPALAARELLALGLPRSTLWLALILMAALQAFLFGLSDMLIPSSAPLPMVFRSPIAFFTMAVFALVLTVYALHWAGRMLGGQGALEDVMVVIAWMQTLRVGVQLLALVLTLTFPGLALLVVFVATVFGIYILLHFINEAHRLNSLVRAGGVLIVALIVMVLGLSLFLSLIGAPLVGAVSYV